MCPARAHFIDLHQPFVGLPGQVVVVEERAARQKVGLHPANQILDRALLIRASLVARFWLKIKLLCKLEEHRVPNRSMMLIAPERDCFHVVVDRYPHHATKALECFQVASQEGLQDHVISPHYERSTAELQAYGEVVASSRLLPQERKVADLPPIHLSILAGQALKAGELLDLGVFKLFPYPGDTGKERRPSLRKRLLRVLTDHFKHALGRRVLFDPLPDLLSVRSRSIRSYGALIALRWRLLQESGDRIPVQPYLLTYFSK